LFENNTADNGGGGLFFYSNSSGIFTDCSLNYNAARLGGAIAIEKSNGTFQGINNFTNNKTLMGNDLTSETAKK
jgi:hypothetical protein